MSNDKYIDVNIRKPLYGNFVYIRDKYIRQAKLQGKLLRITVPKGTAIMSPEDWLKGAEVMKKVFLQPDNPMILYGNHVRFDTQEKGHVIKEPHLEAGVDFFKEYEYKPSPDQEETITPEPIQESLF